MSRHENEEQNHNIKVAIKSSVTVAKQRYFGTTVTNQKLHSRRNYSRLNSGNNCYNFNSESSDFPSSIENPNDLPVVAYGYETRSSTLRK
jgi:hypothetical protein